MTTTKVNATFQQTQLQFGATFADLPVPGIGDSGRDKLVGGNETPKSEGGFAGGITNAAQVVGYYLRLNGDRERMRQVLVDHCGCHAHSITKAGGTLDALAEKCAPFVLPEIDTTPAASRFGARGTTQVMAGFMAKQMSWQDTFKSNKVPGLGDAGNARMVADGITNPVQLVGLYMMLDGDDEEFAKYLKDDCGIGEQYIRSERNDQGTIPGVLEAISTKVAEICAKADARVQHARRETILSAANQIHKVFKQIRPDMEIDAVAMAIVDDYQNDLLSRIVANAAAARAAHSPAYNLEDEALGEGESEFEIVRKYAVERTPVTPADPDGRPEDSSMEAPLLVSVNQMATRADFRALPEGPDAAELKSSSCLTALGIQTAVRLVLPEQLAKYSVSEGNKAVTRFESNRTTNASRARRAGLQFDVESVAARATKVVPGVLLTEGAAVYLAAALEYLVAELLELSGNPARDNNSDIVRPRHVLLAIAVDDELNIMCNGVVFLQAGVLPSVPGTPSRTPNSPVFTPTPAKQAGAGSKHSQMRKRAASTAKAIDSATAETSKQISSKATCPSWVMPALGFAAMYTLSSMM